MSAGAIIGTVTRRNTVQRPAPRLDAASSYRRSIDRRPASTVMTRNGMATNVSASTTPHLLKVNWNPNPS